MLPIGNGVANGIYARASARSAWADLAEAMALRLSL
jgi:hypothetical protein